MKSRSFILVSYRLLCYFN